MTMLFVASDWPIHDIGEQYLYSVHMLQHMMLSYFLPPLALLATPEWLLRTLIGDGRLYHVRALALPPGGRRRDLQRGGDGDPRPRGGQRLASSNGPLHYGCTFMVVTTALLMWMPVCGPIPEFRIGTMPAR